MFCGPPHCSYLHQVGAHYLTYLLILTFYLCLNGICLCSLSRFGSFEIFKPANEFTGRQGPSYGRDEIRGQMMDYVIEMFYPEIQENYPDRVERNVAFFREVRARVTLSPVSV